MLSMVVENAVNMKVAQNMPRQEDIALSMVVAKAVNIEAVQNKPKKEGIARGTRWWQKLFARIWYT